MDRVCIWTEWIRLPVEANSGRYEHSQLFFWSCRVGEVGAGSIHSLCPPVYSHFTPLLQGSPDKEAAALTFLARMTTPKSTAICWGWLRNDIQACDTPSFQLRMRMNPNQAESPTELCGVCGNHFQHKCLGVKGNIEMTFLTNTYTRV